MKIIEANIKETATDKFTTDISTYDILYFLQREGFRAANKQYVIDKIEEFENAGILTRKFCELEGLNDEEIEKITKDDGTFYFHQKWKRIIHLNNEAFYILGKKKFRVISPEAKSKIIGQWLKTYKAREYAVKTDNKGKDFIKIPKDIIADRRLSSKALLCYCAMLHNNNLGHHNNRNSLAKFLQCDVREALRLIEELAHFGHIELKIK